MTAEQLRNSILQEAISGRLVPQDPNDEPASVLLQRIREEKARLVKEKKLKAKDIVVTPITADDIPYEIPNSWEWVRVKELFNVCSARRVHEKDWRSSGIPFYRAREIGKLAEFGHVDNDLYIDQELYNEFSKSGVPQENDLMVTAVGTLGRVYVVKANEIFYYKDGSVLCMENRFGINAKFAKLVIESPVFVSQYIGESQGTTVATLTMVRMNEYLLPLPPLAEQQRIVAKLEELLPIVEQYGKAQTELDKLNTALPIRLRQSILQEAISGRLVPQDENETADGLKEHLLQAVNNSPFKKKWNSELIEDEELPFDIPDNWRWIRLGDIVYTQTGLSYSKGDLEKKVSNPIRVLRGGNIQSGSWCTKDDDVMIAPEFVKKDIFLKKNSFITPAVTSLEHLGKTALIRENHNDIVAGGFVLYLMPYDAANDMLMEYLAYFFQSAFYNSFCKTITNKSGQAFWNISREKLLQLTIPLPPLAEQKRIVAKIEELFAEIDKLK